MSLHNLKSANVIFPWEDAGRTIFFNSSDLSAVDVLSSLVDDKGVKISALHGFSVDEMSFFSSSFGGSIESISRH